jgi:hypothetical protein
MYDYCPRMGEYQEPVITTDILNCDSFYMKDAAAMCNTDPKVITTEDFILLAIKINDNIVIIIMTLPTFYIAYLLLVRQLKCTS